MLSVAKSAKTRMPHWGVKKQARPTRHLRKILSLQCPFRKPLAGIWSLGTTSQERLEQIVGERHEKRLA